VVKALLLFCLVAACAESSTIVPNGASLARPTPDDRDDDDLLSMVPAEADLVLWADMAKLRDSPWIRDSLTTVVSTRGNEPDPGFDLVRDVDHLVFAKLPALQDDASVLIAQGRLVHERMSKAFAHTGVAVAESRYRGADFFVRGEEALAFVGRRTVLSGMTVAVRAAVDCSFGVARAVDSESWIERLRAEIAVTKGSASSVASLFVRLQPGTREELMRETGEGGTMEEFAGRLDLGSDLDLTAVGALRTEAQAHDMVARLAERIREVRNRPIVAAFGFAGVIDSVRFSAKRTYVEGTLHVSNRQRNEISQRMTVVAQTIAKLRADRASAQEKRTP
jgi:uncharacterized small protein (DUF1192 family)